MKIFVETILLTTLLLEKTVWWTCQTM